MPTLPATILKQSIYNPENASQVNKTLNVTNDAQTQQFINIVPWLVWQSVVQTNMTYPYDKFQYNQISQEELDTDTLFNNSIREYINSANVPLNTSSNISGVFKYWSNYITYVFKNSVVNGVPWYEMVFNDVFSNTQGKYAVRMRQFPKEQIAQENLPENLITPTMYNTTLPVLTIVDVNTGEEKFRIIRQTVNPIFLRDVCRVTNGTVDYNTVLRFSEMFDIACCIPISINMYGGADNPKTPLLISTLLGQTPSTTFDEFMMTLVGYQQDGSFYDTLFSIISKDGVFQQIYPRLIAVNKPDNYNGGLLNISWLPWNNPTYLTYDTYLDEYIGVNPFNTTNLITIIKLIGLGFLVYEFYKLLYVDI